MAHNQAQRARLPRKISKRTDNIYDRGTKAFLEVFSLERVSNVVFVLNNILHDGFYHSYSLWLFIFSDLKTIVVPSVIFGISNSFAATRYGLQQHLTGHILRQAPLSLLWVVINFVPFAMNNQRDPQAIAEDTINKPWRPLPSGRMSPERAKYLMILLYIAAQVCSLNYCGGYRQSLGLVILGTWYNNFGGSDLNPLIRNLINAMGYLCFISGAMEVVLGTPIPFGATERLTKWLLIIAGIIMSTIHIQDLYDQKGDAERGRRTAPLVIGDSAARWTIAIPMFIWGIICPVIWNVNAIPFILSCMLATTVAVRTLAFRQVSSDKFTFRIWNCWIACIFIMPLWEGQKFPIM